LQITNRFAALENVSEDEDINRAWESIKENIKTSATENLGMHERKQHKPWFDEECLVILDQRKQAKMQCIQDRGSILARVRNVPDKRCRENQNTHFVFSNLFLKIVPFMR
jgi:hypothetical protein